MNNMVGIRASKIPANMIVNNQIPCGCGCGVTIIKDEDILLQEETPGGRMGFVKKTCYDRITAEEE